MTAAASPDAKTSAWAWRPLPISGLIALPQGTTPPKTLDFALTPLLALRYEETTGQDAAK